MKRTITLLMCMAFALLLTAVAQSITHTFSDVSMSDALKYLQQHTSRYKIVFIYDDLEAPVSRSDCLTSYCTVVSSPFLVRESMWLWLCSV